MLILPESQCLATMASSLDTCSLPKTIDSTIPEPKDVPDDAKTIKSSPVPGQSPNPRQQRQASSSLSQQRRHQQQKEYRQHQQQPRQPHHNWDINDSTIPMPEMYDPFDVWPSGHCRRVYRGDIDDARRHISGWAMRNTNNHNALILKKSCLGVLVCSNDCMFDNGKKVHLRPAICDKARRKQIGKSCPNPGCCGKLTLLPCRGHCGYPVTHFWRQVKGTVFFQAKGYHDHPRPDIKSLSEKGRNALAKHIKHNLNPLVLLPSKRRHSTLSHNEGPVKKIVSKEKEVMCSCSPFECNCKQGALPSNPHPTNCPAFNPVLQPPGPFPQKQFQPGGVTQINITNTCLPPPNLGVNIPYSSGSFLPPNARIYHTNTLVREDIDQFLRYGAPEVPPPPPASTPLTTIHYSYDDFKSRLTQHPYSEFPPRPQESATSEHHLPFPTTIHEHTDNTTAQRGPPQYEHARETSMSPGSSHNIKPEHPEPNFLMPYNALPQDIPPLQERRDHMSNLNHPNPDFLPDFNALNFCPPPERQILHPHEYIDSVENRSSEFKSYQTLNSQDGLQNERQCQDVHHFSPDQETNMPQPTFTTLTSPNKSSYELNSCRQNNVSPHSVPTSEENFTCAPAFTYDSTKLTSNTPPTSNISTITPEPRSTHFETTPHNAVLPLPRHPTGVSDMCHVSEPSGVHLPCPGAVSALPSQHGLQETSGQHGLPNAMGALPYYHGLNNVNTPPTTGFNPYYSDMFQPASAHPQTFQHQQLQQHHQQQLQQGTNSINITLTYN